MKKIALMLALAMALGGCATLSNDYKQGTAAELNRQYDEAVKYYEQASLGKPKEPVYRMALARAKSAASLFHLQEARFKAASGLKKDALLEYGIALAYDPANRTIASEMKALETVAPKTERPPVTVAESPYRLKTNGEKLSLSFRMPVSLRSILDTLGRAGGVTFVYDETFRDSNIAVDLTGKDLEQAVNYLCIASKNFPRILDEKTIIIAPDNMQMRQKYEMLVIKTFYLSNINAQDVQAPLVQMVKSQYKIPVLGVDKNLNTITIRDTPQVVALAEKLLRAWDKPQGEVIIDIEIMEVDRSLLRKLGIDFTDTSLSVELNPELSPGSDSGWINLSGLKLGKLSSYEFTNPAAVLQFLEGDTHTKLVAQPRLRGIAGEEMKYLVGEKVPIITASYTPITGGTTTSQAITQYTQQDVGIDVKIKPRIHLEKEVTLEVEIKVSAISGYSTSSDIPTIATREVKNTIRLRDGETSLLAGLLRDTVQRQNSGITGLKNLPLLGSIFSYTKTTIEQTDLILTMTPHIVRPVPTSDPDAKPLWVDPNAMVPPPSASQGVPEEAAAVAAAPGAENPPAEPEEDKGGNALYVSPGNFEVPKGREFRVNVELSADKEIGALSVNLGFNPQIIKLKEVVEGGVVAQMGSQARFTNYSTDAGCSLGFTGPSLGKGFKGQGILAALVFTAVGQGETAITIGTYSAYGTTGQSVTLSTGESKVVIR